MNQDLLWRRIHANEQKVAEQEQLVRSGENYRLTTSQESALAQLEEWRSQDIRNTLLHAPTGAGKTAVEFRLAVSEFLRSQNTVVVLAPTRDLVRQQVAYFRSRLAQTPLQVAELHGGVSPRDRDLVMDKLGHGMVSILIGSGLLLKDETNRRLLREVGFLIVDDVHAFDPIEHLKPLRGIHTPSLFATATPQAAQDFLAFKDAASHTVHLDETPFETPATLLHTVKGHYHEDPLRQVVRTDAAIRSHIGKEGRIFVVSRTRSQVPRLAKELEDRYGVPTTMLHGDMVDTQEQAKRLNKNKDFRPERTRVAMMKRFKETLPSILVGTNLLGAGLDVAAADLIIITDADGFGDAEIEQLIGRVGRRDRPSEAFLVVGTFEKRRGR